MSVHLLPVFALILDPCMFQETKGVVAAGKSVAAAGTATDVASPAIITTVEINRRNKSPPVLASNGSGTTKSLKHK